MSSSVKDLTRLFEPSISEENDSYLSRTLGAPKIKAKATQLECQHHVPINCNAADEHNQGQSQNVGEDGTDPKSTLDDSKVDSNESNDQAESSQTTGTTDQTNTSPIESSPSGSSPVETSQSQSQSSSPADGDSSDDSSCPLQALQRSPPIAPPSSIRPLGQLAGNMNMFLEHSDCTEAGQSRLREGNIICVVLMNQIHF